MRIRNAVRLLGLSLLVSLAWSDGALAQKLTSLAHPIGIPGRPQASALVHPNSATAARATNPWTPLTNQPTFLVDGASNPILLTDGSVLVQDQGFPD